MTLYTGALHVRCLTCFVIMLCLYLYLVCICYSGTTYSTTSTPPMDPSSYQELGDDAAALLAALTLRCQLQTLRCPAHVCGPNGWRVLFARLPGNCIGDDGVGGP